MLEPARAQGHCQAACPVTGPTVLLITLRLDSLQRLRVSAADRPRRFRTGGAMNAAALRKRLTQSLLDEINEVQFPSVTMMDRVEAALGTAGDLTDYAEVLVKKVEATRYPSISLLNRLEGLLDRLEQFERLQQLQAAEGDGASA